MDQNQEPSEPDIGSSEDWARIEQALGYEGTDPQRRDRIWRELRVICSIYFGFPPREVPEVRSPNVKRALAVLRGHATALQAYLPHGGRPQREPGESIKAFTRRSLNEPLPERPDDGLGELDAWAMAYVSFDILSAEKQQALWDGLAELIAAVDAVSNALPEDRGGRPSNSRLHGMIYELARCYRDHTGREPGLSRDPITGDPGGPFFRFVQTVLRVFVADQVGEDGALYSEIRRTLRTKNWRPVIA